MRNVKSTMVDRLLALVAPHLCSGCGLEGGLLCHNCKYDIISEPFNNCLACGGLTGAKHGICHTCKPSYRRAWCVGERAAALHRLIEQYKFYRAQDASRVLVDLLDATLPVLPANTVIVPIPTLRAHIRQRGYDHITLITHELAYRRSVVTKSYLTRLTATQQLGASRKQRLKQASEAFACNDTLEAAIPYLIIDDVATTGATLEYAARTLKSAGAREIWVASISRQALKINN